MTTTMATATDAAAAATETEKPVSILARLLYPAALLASLSIWFLAIRAPLWLDETLAYWQVAGGFGKVWSRSALMPSSIGYLYTLWLAKSILGSSEIALKIPSTLAMLGAVYFLFRAARELFDQETAFLTCIFFALQYNVVFAATDARPYAFALLATCVAILAFVRWMNGRQIRQAIAFGASAAWILYFHYLFGAILPAFAIYYLVTRFRNIKEDLRQLTAVLASFTLLVIPVILRIASLYRTRETHIVQAMLHPVMLGLNNLAPIQLLVGFVITAFLAALVRKIKLPEQGSFPVILLSPLLALVPALILFSVNTHLIQPRYFLVVTPGSALTWAWLTGRIDSRVLRLTFCTGLVALTAFQAYSSPISRHHALSFKDAHAFVNASVGNEDVPVLVCSAFIESNYEALPVDPKGENALLSQVGYYPINAPLVFLSTELNDEAMRIGRQTVLTAARQHRRFFVVAPPTSYPTIYWLADYSRGAFTVQTGLFDEIMVVEFRPTALAD